eukprot:scaffold36271_cov49-Phaeocystis_antarctica.AAC.1
MPTWCDPRADLGCNHTCPRRQPGVLEAATRCAGGCNHTCPGCTPGCHPTHPYVPPLRPQVRSARRPLLYRERGGARLKWGGAQAAPTPSLNPNPNPNPNQVRKVAGRRGISADRLRMRGSMLQAPSWRRHRSPP